MEKIFSFDIDDEIYFYICEELYKNYILENQRESRLLRDSLFIFLYFG